MIPCAYDSVFVKTMDDLSESFINPKTIKAFYASDANEPKMVTKFYINGELDTLVNYLQNSKIHGFNPEVFKQMKLKLYWVN